MRVEFVAAKLPDDLRKLMTFDRKCFSRGDLFPASYWREIQSYWMLVDGKRVGCSGFEIPLQDDPALPPRELLYIASTAIHPKHRGKGYGSLMKAWQIAYAKAQGYRHLYTHVRVSNRAMIRLNERYAFTTVKRISRYYQDPSESAALMHRDLK
jgi:ribosomal protein S18 acetylase RimI-like enzyme